PTAACASDPDLRSSPPRRSSDLGKLVERQVAVERVDDPVAVAPGERPGAVLLVAVAVGIAGAVEPVAAPALPVVRRRQHALHQSDRKSTRLNSSHVAISYAVCCL